ncbi:hypothetical protein ANTPLA_LOCUS9470 [Anthophora plagiata]
MNLSFCAGGWTFRGMQVNESVQMMKFLFGRLIVMSNALEIARHSAVKIEAWALMLIASDCLSSGQNHAAPVGEPVGTLELSVNIGDRS